MTASPTLRVLVDPSDVGRPGGEPARRRSVLLAVLSVLTGTAAIGWHGALYGNWIVDDAAITFAYARSFADGLGPVVHPGAEAVEGFSNPTWLLLLALGKLVGLFDHGTLFGVPDYVLFPKGLALLCCAGILTVCYLVARRVTRRPWLVTAATGLVLAAIPSFVIWSFSGLENSLYALTVVALAAVLFLAVLDGRLRTAKVALAAGALAAVAALTRPEGLVYAGAYPLLALVLLRRPLLRPSIRNAALSVAAFALPVGGYYAWRLATFGQWLSSPAVAKSQSLPALSDFARPGELVAYAGAPAVLVVAAVLAMALARPLWWRQAMLALLVPLGLALFAYAVLESDWMEQYRFATPVWVLGALVGSLAVADVFRHSRPRRRAWLAAGLVVAALPSGAAYAESAEEFRANPNISACYVADRLGRNFNAYADILGLREASLLLPDLGGSALTTRLHLVDMAGLGEPRIAEFIRNGDMAGLRDYVFEEVKPTFIHSRWPWASGNGISSDPRIARDYHQLYSYPDDDPPNGDWVRKGAVPDQATLAELRRYARTEVERVERDSRTATYPLRSCGDTLRPGQTTVGQT
ncbi:hypothetical protein B0I33_103553 [Prauserella shujinwangii]|uniref:Dolichyl-phosphate-mannose-protein mannosyltransferase n=1 Tax=Prauserella shujinwangii TaxID=1453103 RepID=A0A2T0LZG7_9PSEU|nr:hypothetical protein [Prauserella shujinwangii]PRX49516.1 hypothetical protein B0I33_103553 [Prauserella shujinwangii]